MTRIVKPTDFPFQGELTDLKFAAGFRRPNQPLAISETPLEAVVVRLLLTGVPVENFVPRDRWKEDHERAENMRLWCKEHGHNLLELTLQFTIRETRIHGNPLGSLNKEQLEANVCAACATVSDDVFESFFAANL